MFPGIIFQYELMMRGKPKPDGTHFPLQEVIFRTFGSYNPRLVDQSGTYRPEEPPETNYTIKNLQPFTEYEFLVNAWNTLGTAESSWTTTRTLEGSEFFLIGYFITGTYNHLASFLFTKLPTVYFSSCIYEYTESHSYFIK